MKRRTVSVIIAVVALSLGAFVSRSFAQASDEAGLSGFQIHGKIVVPESSIPRPGHIHTNYFFVIPDVPNHDAPPQAAETPASLACVYKLVKGPKGCPIATSKNVPTGGWGAIGIVDAGDFPTAAHDLHVFSKYFGIPDADFHKVYADGHKPPVYSGWDVEEALDIEWAHAMAPKAKIFLIESKLCTSQKCNTDPTWLAEQVGGNVVAQNGGGVVSNSWGDPEWPEETKYDKYFLNPGVVFFASSGDSGVGASSHPGASPNVVSVGGTYLNRDSQGNFTDEIYLGGTGNISPYEARPSYQDIIKKIVGSKRGYPDVGSPYCYAPIYISAYGGWNEVCGTSWSSPTFAGIVNAAASKKKSTKDELTMIYTEYANKKEYKADFYDITSGDSHCAVGWDLCDGVGSPRTYKGK